MSLAKPTRFGEGPQRVRVEQEVLSRLFDTGFIMLWAASAPPSGFVELDGSVVSRLQYQGLFALFGESYGGGDGVTTFQLPDWSADAPSGGMYIVRV